MQPTRVAADPTGPARAEHEALVDTLSGLMRTYRHHAQLLYKAWGVAGFAAPVLSTLDRAGALRLTDLACALTVDASVISRQSAELVRDGLLERRADPADGRASLLQLTEHGRAVLAGLRDKRLRSLQTALSGWTSDDITTLTTLLARLQADTAGLADLTHEASIDIRTSGGHA